MSLVLEDAKRLAARNQAKLESARALEVQVHASIEGLKLPGLLFSRADRQRFEGQLRELHIEGQAAVDGQVAARKGLKQAEDMEASPQALAIERIRNRDPGLVTRIVPMLKDAKLLDDAKRYLQQQRADETAASRARLLGQKLERKPQAPEHER